MIESSRRHGHFDPRWNTSSPRSPNALKPAPGDGDPSIQRWESEGGRCALSAETRGTASSSSIAG